MPESFRPTASIETLYRRAKLFRDVRRFFDDRDFLEVDTPILSADIVVDRYLEPISVHVAEIGLTDTDRPMMWLQTSPEFAMKRLLAAGATAIYQITHAFRANEIGDLHNPEFAMLEWYRTGDDLQAGMQLLAEFARTVFGCESVETITYRDAFARHAGFDVLGDDEQLLQIAAIAGAIDPGQPEVGSDIDECRNFLLTHVVQPNLGLEQPVIVYDWPASQSALARVRHETPPVAERFELFHQGVELANGYHELVDADELGARNQRVNRLRESDGNRILPEDSRLLDAMRAGLPPCSGVAVGLDRVLMLLAGGNSIREVMPFPISIA